MLSMHNSSMKFDICLKFIDLERWHNEKWSRAHSRGNQGTNPMIFARFSDPPNNSCIMGIPFENLVRDVQSKLHLLFLKKADNNPGRSAMVAAANIPWYIALTMPPQITTVLIDMS